MSEKACHGGGGGNKRRRRWGGEGEWEGFVASCLSLKGDTVFICRQVSFFLTLASDTLGESISSCHEQKRYPLFLGSLRIILCNPPSLPLPSHSLHPRRPSELLLPLPLPFPSCVHTIRGRGKEREGEGEGTEDEGSLKRGGREGGGDLRAALKGGEGKFLYRPAKACGRRGGGGEVRARDITHPPMALLPIPPSFSVGSHPVLPFSFFSSADKKSKFAVKSEL